jgi:hypothetical protein
MKQRRGAKTEWPRAKDMKAKQREELLSALKSRFEKGMRRHKGIEWTQVQAKLEAAPEKLWSLNEMERTGGEPDVVGHDKKTGEYIFFDCSAQSPAGRRSLCYDREGLQSRKEHQPENSAIDMATAMGVELLTEEQHVLNLAESFSVRLPARYSPPTASYRTPVRYLYAQGMTSVRSWRARAH